MKDPLKKKKKKKKKTAGPARGPWVTNPRRAAGTLRERDWWEAGAKSGEAPGLVFLFFLLKAFFG